MSVKPALSCEQARRRPPSPDVQDRILVIDDDPSVRRILKRLLDAEGFAVEVHSDGRAGLDSFHADVPSATILDLTLPKLSGKHLCREMKNAAPSVPILVVSACCDVGDKVQLLEMGADDYITKPFSPRELLARLRVALRHTEWPATESSVCFDDIVVDFGQVEVTRNGIPVEFTAQEFKTLQFLIKNPDRVVTRTELLREVCGYRESYTAPRSIDNHMVKLRHALENDPKSPTHFLTIPRLGFKFVF